MEFNNYDPLSYFKYVENSKLDWFREYIEKEVFVLNNVLKDDPSHLVDIGAGYGRVLEFIDNSYLSYLGIELNQQMCLRFRDVYSENEKLKIYNGNVDNIDSLLKNFYHEKEMYIILQNTLGTLKDQKSSMKSLTKYFANRKCKLLISVLNRKHLATQGLSFYKSIEPICGKIDNVKSKIEKGVFVSNTNYRSKWWSKDEITRFVRSFSGKIERVHDHEIFQIFEIHCQPDEGGYVV